MCTQHDAGWARGPPYPKPLLARWTSASTPSQRAKGRRVPAPPSCRPSVIHCRRRCRRRDSFRSQLVFACSVCLARGHRARDPVAPRHHGRGAVSGGCLDHRTGASSEHRPRRAHGPGRLPLVDDPRRSRAVRRHAFHVVRSLQCRGHRQQSLLAAPRDSRRRALARDRERRNHSLLPGTVHDLHHAGWAPVERRIRHHGRRSRSAFGTQRRSDRRMEWSRFSAHHAYGFAPFRCVRVGD